MILKQKYHKGKLLDDGSIIQKAELINNSVKITKVMHGGKITTEEISIEQCDDEKIQCQLLDNVIMEMI